MRKSFFAILAATLAIAGSTIVASSGLALAAEGTGFTDVDSGAFYAAAVEWAQAEGVTTGTSATTFSPDLTMTRAQGITMLYRDAGSPTGSAAAGFTDVPASSFFAAAVDWAKAKGVTTGTTTTTFSPDRLVTRAEGVTMLHRQPVDLQFLTLSDWHAQLDPLGVFGVGDFGGAAVLAAYWDADRANNPNTVTLMAGDSFGGAPPLSGFFDEEPAVRAMRMMGVDVDTFGNHSFDQGISHLQRMVTFAGASSAFEPGEPFSFVSANLTNRDDNLTGVEDFVIIERNGFKIAVIGVTNPEAPTLVFPGNFGSIVVSDPAVAAQAARSAAEAAGADVFVAVAHLGVDIATDGGAGPLVDFANAVTGFGLIVGDHTNFEFSGEINGALVVENRSKGRTYARVTMNATRGGEVFGSTVEFVEPVSDDVTPDAEIAALLDPLRAQLDTLLSGVLGSDL